LGYVYDVSEPGLLVDLLAAVAYTDRELIVVGGSWGRLPDFTEALDARTRNWPRSIPVVASALDEEADLRGARSRAVELLQSAIVAAARQSEAPGARTSGSGISPPRKTL
jgi:hypothetical protein